MLSYIFGFLNELQKLYIADGLIISTITFANSFLTSRFRQESFNISKQQNQFFKSILWFLKLILWFLSFSVTKIAFLSTFNEYYK